MENKLFELEKFSSDFPYWKHIHYNENYNYIKHSNYHKFRVIDFNVFGIRLDYLK